MTWGAVGAAAIGVGGALLNKPKKQSQTSTTERPAWLDDASQNLLGRANTIADRNYQGYDGRQRVAGLSGNEQLAYGQAATLQGRYQPMLDRASTQFSSGALQGYMNPYRDQVMNIQARRINEDYEGQLKDLNAKRGMMDAFGTDRGTMLETELQKQRSQALRDAEYTGLSDAYTQGTNAFFNDRTGALQAAQVGMNMDNQAIGALQSTGVAERQTRQALQDFDYGQFLEQRDWDVTNLEPLLRSISAASGAAGSSTTTTGTPAGPSTGGMLAGLAATVGGIYLNNRQPSAGALPTGYGGGPVPGTVQAGGGLVGYGGPAMVA